MKRIKSILEGVYNNCEARRNIVPLFLGNSGLGKTKLIQQFAKELGVNLVEFITSQRIPQEISGIMMPDKETKRMGIWDFDQMLSLKDGDILFFDEVLNGNPAVLNACLTLLEGRRMISGRPLPDIMIIAAANPQGMCPLTPQIKERFLWYDVSFDETMWVNDYMRPKYGITPEIGEKLSKLIKSEDFSSYNFMTPRSIDKNINLILSDIPTPYESILLPILSTMVQNTFSEPVQLTKDKVLEPNEMIPWIDLIKYKLYGKIKK